MPTHDYLSSQGKGVCINTLPTLKAESQTIYQSFPFQIVGSVPEPSTCPKIMFHISENMIRTDCYAVFLLRREVYASTLSNKGRDEQQSCP